nr:hypothetical protein [Tanacetum cinerariifolium]
YHRRTLSPDYVFDFPVDKSELHLAYDFFTPGPLPRYAGNSNNNNGWIKADVPLLGELRAVADEPMVSPLVDEIAEPIVKVEEQVIALVIDMDEDIAMLFEDDDFTDDDSERVEEEEAAVQQRDTQIQQLQTTVSEMSSWESTLMQCILGMDRRLADLERRPPGP